MYRDYALELDQLGRDAIEKIKKATEKTQAANRAVERARMEPDESPAAYKARKAALAARAEQLRDELRTTAKTVPVETDRRIAEIRERLAAAVHADHLAKPGEVDTAVLTLVDSGILRPDEFVALFNGSATPTMRRLIGAAAGRRAAELQTTDPNAASVLRNVENAGRRCDGREYLSNFDALADVVRRTTRNTGMNPHYDRLVQPILDTF